jgi:hypothetical protein
MERSVSTTEASMNFSLILPPKAPRPTSQLEFVTKLINFAAAGKRTSTNERRQEMRAVVAL